MARASSKNKGPKFDPRADYLLRTIPVPEGVITNRARPVAWVSEIVGGIELTTDVNKARKFRGTWLSETVWSFEIFFTAVVYEQAIIWWKQQQKKRKRKITRRKIKPQKSASPKGRRKKARR